MSKFMRVLENVSLPAVAIMCVLISLGDLFDVLHIFDSRIPMLTLLVLSISLETFIVTQKRCSEMRKDIARILTQEQLKYLGKVVEQVDPELRKVLGDDYFHDIFDFAHEAIDNQRVQINNETRFFYHFIRMLKSHPKATFLSASTSPFIHLYRDTHIEEAVKNFTLRGGKIKQFFFLKNKQELATPEVQTQLKHLQDIGVRVYIAYTTATPNELKKNVFVETRGKIAWEMHISDDGHIVTSILTTQKQTTSSLTRIFEKLRGDEFHALAAL